MSFNFNKKIKIGAAIVMLFAAVAVDFMSKFLSIGFDLLFIGIAVWIMIPVIKGDKKGD